MATVCFGDSSSSKNVRLEEVRNQALGFFPGLSAGELAKLEVELSADFRRLDPPEASLAKACLAWVVSARAQEGTVLERRRLFLRGIRLLDEAVEEAPGDIRVRLLRAQHSAILPRAFGREDIAEGDFRRLLDRMAKSDNAETPDSWKAQVFFFAASWSARNDDFEEALRLLGQADALDRVPEEWRVRIANLRRSVKRIVE